jgi:hypothetical protein
MSAIHPSSHAHLASFASFASFARLARLAQARARRRSQSDGGVVFIVAMTLSVLAAVGMYALRAASTELKTSGYERQNAQTHYLTEYGVLAAAQEVNASKAQLYVGLMSDTRSLDSGCISLAPALTVGGVPSTATLTAKACRRMGAAELTRSWKNLSNTPVLSPTVGATPGSMGSAPINGDFFIELTDLGPTAPPAGFDLKLGLCFMQMTVTSVGVTTPIISNDTAKFASEGLETARARIIFGPVKTGCPSQ